MVLEAGCWLDSARVVETSLCTAAAIRLLSMGSSKISSIISLLPKSSKRNVLHICLSVWCRRACDTRNTHSTKPLRKADITAVHVPDVRVLFSVSISYTMAKCNAEGNQESKESKREQIQQTDSNSHQNIPEVERLTRLPQVVFLIW